MTKLTRRRLLQRASALAAASTLSTPYISRAQARTLTVTAYGGAYEKFFRETLIPDFEKHLGVKVAMQIGPGKDHVATLRAAGPDNPPVDVCMINEVLADILRGEGYFVPLLTDKITNLGDVASIARYPGDIAIIGWIQPIGLAYRSDLVKSAPTSWTDLWNRPEFKGKIGMYNITNPAGIMFVLLTAKIFGGSEYQTDAAFREIAKLKPFNQLDFSGTMEVQLSRGEVVVGALDYAAVIRLQRRGLALAGAVMKEGMFMFEQVFNITKGSKNKELANEWVNYILSLPVQNKLMNGFYVSPVNLKVVVPEGLKSDIMISGDRLNEVIRFDWTEANKKRDALIERWNREMT